MQRVRTVITGTGTHIPSVVVPNSHFLDHDLRSPDGEGLKRANPEILAQFESITGIRERRYAPPDLTTSDMGADAAAQALAEAKLDPEELDYIIFAHNFGDVRPSHPGPDLVPALAARVKAKLRIRNARYERDMDTI